MDLNDYWQENKRFLLSIAAGLVVFVIGIQVVKGLFRTEAISKKGAVTRIEGDLRKPMYSNADLTAASSQNRELEAALAELRGRVEFRPREEFDASGRSLSVSNVYFATVTDVRDDLLTRCSRANLRIPDDLGLPDAVVREQEILRYLEALDVVERTVSMAIEAEVARVDSIQITLDSALLSGKALKTFENTRIAFKLSGPSGPLVRLLALIQRPIHGQTLMVEEVDLRNARGKSGEAQLELTLLAIHLWGIDEEEGA